MAKEAIELHIESLKEYGEEMLTEEGTLDLNSRDLCLNPHPTGLGSFRGVIK